MTSIAVVTSCTGAEFWKFLPEWATALTRLERQADQIVIASDAPPSIRADVDALIDAEWVEPTRTWLTHPAYLVNDAIANTDADWIAKLDVDDLALPGYLTGIDDSDADVWCVGYRLNGYDIAIPAWDAEAILRASNNLLASCSPFRRWLWEAAEWPDAVFDDWCFWLHAARQGATFQTSGLAGYEYRQHPHQVTRHADLGLAAQHVAEVRC